MFTDSSRGIWPYLAGFVHLIAMAGSQAAPGSLDTTFAGTGTTRLRFGFGEDFAYAVAVQPDGKVVVGGSSTTAYLSGTHLALVRYETNNVLDPSFGNGGKVITAASSDTNASAAVAAIKIQQDGRIVVAGTLFQDRNNFALLARFNQDGSLDESFGQGGIVTNLFSFGARGNALALQSDGKIIVGGLAYTASFNSEFALARYQTNGTLDPTFNGTGMVMTDARGNAEVNGVTLQVDGKIIAAGNGGPDFAVCRYTTNGALDPTFGVDRTGKLFTHLGGVSDPSRATAVAIEPGDSLQTLDRIVVGGYTRAFDPPRFEVVRYKLDGSLDASFGGTGIVTVPVSTSFFTLGASVLVQGTGLEPRKIIVAGYSSSNFKYDFCTVRLHDDGTPDNSFDGDGKAYTSFGSMFDSAHGAVLLPGGKLLVVGSTQVNQNNFDFALARYNLSDGSLDPSFDDDGKLTQDVAERLAIAKAVAIQADGRIVVAGSTVNGINYGPNHSTALARLGVEGELDVSFGHHGRTTVTFGEADAGLNAVAIQPNGKIVAAGFAGTNFLVMRCETNGVLDRSFNGTGIAVTPIAADGNIATALALQSDGKIVVVGSTSFGDEFAVLRYKTDGTPDSSFDADGKLTVAVDVGINQATGVRIQSDGKIIVGGYSVIGGRTVEFTAVRLRTNGVIDSSFGTFGTVAATVDSGQAIANAMAIQPDGKILLAGLAVVGTDIDFAVMRFDTNGVLDASFDGDGKLTTAIGLTTDWGMAIALQPDGKILLTGSTTIVGHPQFVAVRYLTNGTLDMSYGVNGKAFVDFANNGNNTPYALALDLMGRAVIAGDADGFFGIARLQANPHLQILSINRLPNGQMRLVGAGVPNGTHTMQWSTNPIFGSFGSSGTVAADRAGRWQYDDAGAAGFPQRFYRVIFP